MPALPLHTLPHGLRRGVLWLWGCALLLGLGACSSLPPMPARSASTALATPQHTPLGQMVQSLRHTAQTPHHTGFALLGGAEAAFASRLALIDNATQTLDLQYYAIHADPSTARLLEALVHAAQRGVRVRILLDDFHSDGKNAQVMRLAFVPGIEMRMFNPLTGPRSSPALRALSTLTDFQRAQQRMHNKLFIADNSIGITGGRNLGDAYFDALDNNNFIDLDVIAAGQAVRQLSSHFDRYWNDARAYPAKALVSHADLLQQPSATAAAASAALEHTIASGKLAQLPAMDLPSLPWIWAPALVLADAPEKIPAPADDGSSHDSAIATQPAPSATSIVLPLRSNVGRSGPDTPNRRALDQALAPIAAQTSVVDGLLALMDQAHSDVLIVSPYFVPGSDMKNAFARARQRGVRVRILTNSLASNDAPLAHAGYARHRSELLAQGIELYELRSLQNGQVGQGTLRNTAHAISGSQGHARAMLHAKIVVLDQQLTVIGSMNLDMRSQLQNTEIALLIASRQLAQAASQHIEAGLHQAAWQLQQTPQGLVWRAPPESGWGDQTSEPDASLPLRLMMRLIGPLAPDHLL